MRKRLLCFFTLFILFGGTRFNAGAAEWTPFVEDHAFRHAYDKQSIVHTPKGIVRVAIKVDPKGKEGRDFLLEVRKKIGLTLEGYDHYGFSLTVMEIDCANHQKRILESNDFNQKGELLDSVSSPNPKWAPIATDSIHGLYQKVFCKR
ncbi:MAG: hypothetical protein HY282_00235 [Nitrospirae bacterium]|nr:hypothetical protein [Candidatus Manganitrophaceae bacterium]